MKNIQYTIDNQGNKTGLFIDLSNTLNNNIFKNFNQAQLDFLKLFEAGISDENLTELKQIVASFLATKLLNNGDKIWQEKKYSEKDFENFVNND